MYDRNEISRIRQEFWTAFGLYMAPLPGADGGKTNWVNYKTGEKDMYFRMNAGLQSVSIAIECRHANDAVRQVYFDQLHRLQPLLETHLQEPWEWEPDCTDDYGRSFSRVICRSNGISIMNKNDWPQLISFLKPRIIALDAFWAEARYYFEALK